jgi:hypothetical protein
VAGSLEADVAALTPEFHVPADLAVSATVGLICDDTEGLLLLANFRLVQEAFENPDLAADREHQRAVLGYLREGSISALPFRRLAEADTARASQLFQRLLKRPGFSWERDGEALLRKNNHSASAPSHSLRSRLSAACLPRLSRHPGRSPNRVGRRTGSVTVSYPAGVHGHPLRGLG